MNRLHLALPSLALVALLSGCATSGVFPSASLTTVELSEANFEIVATDVGGTATAAYVFGVSGGVGVGMQTLAVARIEGEGDLYAAALRDLWRNFEEMDGPVVGRRLALVNVRHDTEALNLFVYTRPTVWIRADVVEFGP